MKKNVSSIENRNLAAQRLRDNIEQLYSELSDKLNINQKKLAELCNLDEVAITRMKTTTSPNLSWYSVYCLCKTLGISMESLIEGTYDIKKIKSNLGKKLK